MHARSTINAAQSQALARLVHELHPTWDIPGIAAAISKSKDRGTIEEICIAAVRVAMRDDLRSPAILASDGPHWRGPAGPVTNDHRFDRCPEPGHQSFPAWNCSACRSEDLEGTHPGSTPVRDRDRADVYDRGAAMARAAIKGGAV